MVGAGSVSVRLRASIVREFVSLSNRAVKHAITNRVIRERAPVWCSGVCVGESARGMERMCVCDRRKYMLICVCVDAITRTGACVRVKCACVGVRCADSNQCARA